MALLETKIIQVANSPETINNSNEEWGYFGWSVQNVQVTHSQNTKTYTKGYLDYVTGDKTVETTTINYATITYQRDKHMPNYHRIVELENEYHQLLEELASAYESGKPSLITVIKSLKIWDWAIIVFLVAASFTASGTAIFTYYVWAFSYFLIRCFMLKRNPKLRNAKIDELIESMAARREAIIQEANALIE